MVVDRSSMSPQMQNLREASSDSTEAEGETAKRTAVLNALLSQHGSHWCNWVERMRLIGRGGTMLESDRERGIEGDGDACTGDSP